MNETKRVIESRNLLFPLHRSARSARRQASVLNADALVVLQLDLLILADL